ncbi:Demethylrebeccamycin-D-glucose O-methyltransferase [Planctomycetes bacterium Pan216]|uniref:Demethylrebeccamycin-D-glucose O-methyltransferase n=1 Tax=Kolteria novifilia TaxID=2527975 RepID=A0A518AX76_9BACT|nr:Demethylrebeccamycin-D-glucose O-methyltransferase [Planctomycetes bacterium Pan216]
MNEVDRRFAARRRLWDEALTGLSLEGKSVLDAGTGEGHFTRYLAESAPGRLVSVTCLEEEVPPARARVAELADRVEFTLADVTAMTQIPDASFDVVGADYLIAAVAAYSPYREIDCLKELKRVLRPGGRLVVTGWEVSPLRRSRAEAHFRELFRLREAINLLAGIEPFREHPRRWVEDRLVDLGMPPERHHEVPDVHHDIGWYIEGCRRKLSLLDCPDLREVLGRQVDDVAGHLEGDPSFVGGFEFGRLYAVVACKLDGALLLG